jgi:hypothetical protein
MGSVSTVTRTIKRKPKIGGGSKKGRQNMHNMATGKYVRQRARTEANAARKRARRLAKAKKLGWKLAA